MISICNSLLCVTSICNSLALPDQYWACHATTLGQKMQYKGNWNAFLESPSLPPPMPGPDSPPSPCNGFRRKEHVRKGQVNHIHFKPSFTEAELQSLQPRVPSMPPLPPEVEICAAWRGVRVKMGTAARQAPATRSKVVTPVLKMVNRLAE